MATIYVTTNASSGDGSLVAAVAAAQDGDIIRIDDSLYPYCAITLFETLVFNTSVTIPETGIVLRLGGNAFTQVTIASGANVVINDLFIMSIGAGKSGTHGYIVSVTGDSALTLNRARILGCYSANHSTGGTVGTTGGSITLNSCVITGCYAKNGAVFSSSASGNELHINDSTIIGNIPRDIYSTQSTTVTIARTIFQESLNVPAAALTNCVHGAPSSLGFEAPPPDTIDSETWSASAQSNYLLYLTSNSVAKSGRGVSGGYDQDFLPRKTDGAIGAYEYYPADYYIARGSGKVSPTRSGPFETITPNNISGSVFLCRSILSYNDLTIDLNGATINELIVAGLSGNQTIQNGTFGTLETPGSVIVGKHSKVTNLCDTVVNINDFIAYANADPLNDETIFSFSGDSIKVVGSSEYDDWGPAGFYLDIGFNEDEGQTVEFLDDFPSGLLVTVVCANSAKINTLILHNDVSIPALFLQYGAVVNSGFVSISEDYNAELDEGLCIDTAGTITAPILAIDPNTDITRLTTDATVCDYGAGLTSFNATPDGNDIVFEWTKTNSNRTVLLQQKDALGEWSTVQARASGTSYTGGDATITPLELRAFDGDRFFSSRGLRPIQSQQFSALCTAYGINQHSDSEWFIKTKVIAVDDNVVLIDQAVTLLAQISDSFYPSNLFLNDGSNVQGVNYTAYRIANGAFSQGTATPIEGHTNVTVSNDCVLSAAQTSDRWTLDNVGFTFALTPDITTNPIFTQVGEYSFKVTITPVSGNPIVFYIPVTVRPLEN